MLLCVIPARKSKPSSFGAGVTITTARVTRSARRAAQASAWGAPAETPIAANRSQPSSSRNRGGGPPRAPHRPNPFEPELARESGDVRGHGGDVAPFEPVGEAVSGPVVGDPADARLVGNAGGGVACD